MIDELDLLLEQVREEPPFDEAFVQRVMHEVRADEQRRIGRRMLRRPVIMAIAAAAVVTGGTVAAVVGSNPERRLPEAKGSVTSPSAVVASEKPDAAAGGAPRTDVASPAGPAEISTKSGKGYLTDHTSYVVDAKTGLRLQTESYTNEFVVDEPQRVTLTLSNGGRYPIAITSPKACGLLARAVESRSDGEASIAAEIGSDPGSTGGSVEWACAGSDADPRTPATTERSVLRPGEKITADAMLSLPRAGSWNLVGMCRCSYTQVGATPVPKSDPISDLAIRTLPSPLLPEEPDGENLATPPIAVRSR